VSFPFGEVGKPKEKSENTYRNPISKAILAGILKVILEHALPTKVDYFRVFAEVGRANLFLSVDGLEFRCHARLKNQRSRRADVPRTFSDSEYTRYRMSHPVKKILAKDEDEVVVKTDDNVEETWFLPRWLLAGRRKLNKR
jgi:hypothetical protein